MSISLPAYTALSPGLYLIAVAQIWLRPWVFNEVTKVWEKGTGDFIPLGDCDDFKTSFTTQKQSRFARDQRVRTKVLERVTQTEMGVAFKAMQHSGLVRAMSLLDELEAGDDETMPNRLINIGKVAQHDFEAIVDNVGEQGPEGRMLLHRMQVAPNGDQPWVGADEFVGHEFSGSAVSVPGLGLGVWAPRGTLLPGEVVVP